MCVAESMYEYDSAAWWCDGHCWTLVLQEDWHLQELSRSTRARYFVLYETAATAVVPDLPPSTAAVSLCFMFNVASRPKVPPFCL